MTDSEIVNDRNPFKRTTLLLQGRGMDGLLGTTMVCLILAVKRTTIIDWCQRGIVTPKVKGTRASHSSHLFGYKTLLGMARALAYAKVYGRIPYKLAKYIIETDETTPDAELETFWRTRRERTKALEDSRIEETFSEMVRDLYPGDLTEEEQQWAEETLKRQERVIEAFGLFGYDQPDQRPQQPQQTRK